jgi:hypothetical protein
MRLLAIDSQGYCNRAYGLLGLLGIRVTKVYRVNSVIGELGGILRLLGFEEIVYIRAISIILDGSARLSAAGN